ncbi:hypothetical protein [Streptomyces sp. NBC_00203]|uniref:hypothetical protein n=1 Tax=Streptomyces sp. NBC_00203 TaxID=2975680 RepID=UPI0032537455
MSILSLFYGWAQDEELTTVVPFTCKQVAADPGNVRRLPAARPGRALYGSCS